MNRRSILKLGLLGLAALGAPLKTLAEEPRSRTKPKAPEFILHKVPITGRIHNATIDRPGCELVAHGMVNIQGCELRCARLSLSADGYGYIANNVLIHR
jgi:hypothetical protein